MTADTRPNMMAAKDAAAAAAAAEGDAQHPEVPAAQ